MQELGAEGCPPPNPKLPLPRLSQGKISSAKSPPKGKHFSPRWFKCYQQLQQKSSGIAGAREELSNSLHPGTVTPLWPFSFPSPPPPRIFLNWVVVLKSTLRSWFFFFFFSHGSLQIFSNFTAPLSHQRKAASDLIHKIWCGQKLGFFSRFQSLNQAEMVLMNFYNLSTSSNSYWCPLEVWGNFLREKVEAGWYIMQLRFHWNGGLIRKGVITAICWSVVDLRQKITKIEIIFYDRLAVNKNRLYSVLFLPVIIWIFL